MTSSKFGAYMQDTPEEMESLQDRETDDFMFDSDLGDSDGDDNKSVARSAG